MQESCPCGNDTAERRGWLVSSLEPVKTTEVGGAHMTESWPDSLINPHGEIVMFLFEPLEWCN